MSRRKAYSQVKKTKQIRAKHVKGMGDTLFRGFQCLNPECDNFIFVKDSDIGENFCIRCPKCAYEHKKGGVTKFFEYSVEVKNSQGDIKIDSQGDFIITHKDYIKEAMLYKYCIVCNTLKPLEYFDNHASRTSGKQGECRLCKKLYNNIKNRTRISDQHREAAQKRRLLIEIAGTPKIDSEAIEKRFGHKCFCCGKSLKSVASRTEKPLDHTLPVYYLWPLTSENATLLCRDCNGKKTGTWPSDFYGDKKLKELSVITGIDYQLLAGKPKFNPEAIEALHDTSKVDNLLRKFAKYMDDIINLRNRILEHTQYDFFKNSSTISDVHVRKADEILNAKSQAKREGS